MKYLLLVFSLLSISCGKPDNVSNEKTLDYIAPQKIQLDTDKKSQRKKYCLENIDEITSRNKFYLKENNFSYAIDMIEDCSDRDKNIHEYIVLKNKTLVSQIKFESHRKDVNLLNTFEIYIENINNLENIGEKIDDDFFELFRLLIREKSISPENKLMLFDLLNENYQQKLGEIQIYRIDLLEKKIKEQNKGKKIAPGKKPSLLDFCESGCLLQSNGFSIKYEACMRACLRQ